MRRRFAPGLAAILMLLACHVWTWGQTAGEYQVKAAYLYNFAKFVEWPGAAFASPTAPFQFCIFGDNPFGSDLEKLVGGKSIAQHPVRVRQVEGMEPARACHILFVGTAHSRRTRQILDGVRGASVLTVGETEGFAEQGGVVNFVLRDDRVQFEVNRRAAEKAGLNISSKLLMVARTIVQ